MVQTVKHFVCDYLILALFFILTALVGVDGGVVRGVSATGFDSVPAKPKSNLLLHQQPNNPNEYARPPDY
jgi:hypothetical protein